jgi:RimJ/RimL family protein N-acetyltransferase
MQVSLLSCDLPMLELAVDDPKAFEQRLGAAIAADWPDYPSAMLVSRDKLRANPGLSGWWTHVVLVDSPPIVVGVCGYTGPPNEKGEVEIAYGTAPAYRIRGVATSAAAALIRRAFADDRTRLVCAHTLPQHNASTRILQKLGMQFAGLANDPDEGTVWRWELTRPSTGFHG